MKQGVKTGHAYAARRRLNVLEKSREAAQDFTRCQIFSDLEKFIERHTSLSGARYPWRRLDFIDPEFAFQGEQNVPFSIGQIDRLNRNHLSGVGCSAPNIDCFATNMADTQRENSFSRHYSEMLGADLFREQLTMLSEGETRRHFDRRP